MDVYGARMIELPREPNVVGTADGRSFYVGGDLVTFKAVAAGTNGSYALFDVRTDPGAGMPLHRQWYDDEALWIVEGQYRVRLDNREVRLAAGDYVSLPRGAVHGYANPGDSPARMLVIVTPGGIHERFFAEVGEPVADRIDPSVRPAALDLQRLRQVARKYGIDILMPAT